MYKVFQDFPSIEDGEIYQEDKLTVALSQDYFHSNINENVVVKDIIFSEV